MKKNRITKTATQHIFTREEGGQWTINNAETDNWTDSLPTDTFLALGKSGQFYSVSVADDRKELTFIRDDEEPVVIGYEANTKITFLDIDHKAFMSGKELFFRLHQQTEEDNR